MTHFDWNAWMQFVHGGIGDQERRRMELHLKSGCRKCRETVALLADLQHAALADRIEPPGFAVATAKALFERQPKPAVAPGQVLKRLLARLVFDSALVPAPAGARSVRGMPRQAVYRAGLYCVDLKLDSEPESRRITLVGQLANERKPGASLSSVPVRLAAGGKTIHETACNAFGEFTLQYVPKKRMKLCVPLEEAGEQIQINLDRFLPIYPG